MRMIKKRTGARAGGGGPARGRLRAALGVTTTALLTVTALAALPQATAHAADTLGAAAAERVAETLMRAFRALQREPHLADAMVRALTFADRSVSPEVDQVSRQTTVIILDAMGLADPTPDQLSAVRVIEHTWHSALITWLSGRASIAQVKIDIETVCRLIDLTAPEET